MKHLVTFILLALCLSAQIPDGYYDPADGLTGVALQQALHNIIDDHTIVGYSDLWTYFQTTDVHPDSAGMVWDMYSDIPGDTPPYWLTYVADQDKGSGGTVEGDKYNREHSWPQSWFNKKSPMVSDIFHIYPTDKKVNSMVTDRPTTFLVMKNWASLALT